MSNSLPSQSYLQTRLAYDPETGILTWKTWGGDKPAGKQCQWNGHYAGQRAGCLRKDGYRSILIDNQRHLEHRVVWVLTHGSAPAMIDHRNGKRDDNRIDNLRPSNKSRNAANQRLRPDNVLGIRGVGKTKAGTFTAKITVNGKARWLGTYSTPQVAAWAYNQAAMGAFGEYAYAARSE